MPAQPLRPVTGCSGRLALHAIPRLVSASGAQKPRPHALSANATAEFHTLAPHDAELKDGASACARCDARTRLGHDVAGWLTRAHVDGGLEDPRASSCSHRLARRSP